MEIKYILRLTCDDEMKKKGRKKKHKTVCYVMIRKIFSIFLYFLYCVLYIKKKLMTQCEYGFFFSNVQFFTFVFDALLYY